MTNYTPKPELTKLTDVDFHVCDHADCPNSYTPYESVTGDRYCLTHAKQ
jgi:hypothetical protein